MAGAVLAAIALTMSLPDGLRLGPWSMLPLIERRAAGRHGDR